MTRQQWSKSILQAAERAGGKPLLPSLPHWGRWNDAFLSGCQLWSKTKPIAKDAAKDSKEPAVEASFSSAPTPQAEDASEPLFWCSLASKHWGKTRQRLGASKPLLTCFLLSQVKALPATSQPSSFAKLRTRQSLSKQVNNASKPFQASAKRVRALELARLFDAFSSPSSRDDSSASQPSSFAKLGTRQGLSELLSLKSNTCAKRVKASEPAKHPLLSPDAFSALSSCDVAIQESAELLYQLQHSPRQATQSLIS